MNHWSKRGPGTDIGRRTVRTRTLGPGSELAPARKNTESALKWIPSYTDEALHIGADLLDPFLILGNALADVEAGPAA
eukprot:2827404-Pyramimonas_sp.AAC.1